MRCESCVARDYTSWERNSVSSSSEQCRDDLNSKARRADSYEGKQQRQSMYVESYILLHVFDGLAGYGCCGNIGHATVELLLLHQPVAQAGLT